VDTHAELLRGRGAVSWTVAVGEGAATSVIWEPAARPSGAVFVCAHGAGGHMADRSVLAMTAALRDRGVGTIRFNFLYREKKQGRPDPMPRLLACFDAVVAHVRAELAPAILILGGRSMGGRAASVLVSNGAACDGLLLLAYPLHPPGQPEKLRVDHLSAIHVPVLCINGTRDEFCTPELMERTLVGLGPNWRMHWLADADHSFHVLKRSGRTNEAALAEAADESTRWTDTLGRVGRG
jgi:predicted alpha/beta-hydrolase family hydrolase